MLEGIDDTEFEAYLDDHLWIVPLFEVDIIETATEDDYQPDTGSIMELSKARTRFESPLWH